MFDTTSVEDYPIFNFHEHSQEVASVDWNGVSKKKFVSSSHSGDIKVWDVFNNRSIVTFAEHFGPVYCVKWSPRFDSTFLSAGGDGFVKIFDTSK